MVEKNDIEIEYGVQLQEYKPIEFKGITLYPVFYRDINVFSAAIYSLLYDPLRHSLPISTLPRLYFLTDCINHQNDGEYVNAHPDLINLWTQLTVLLSLVLKEQKFNFVDVGNGRWALVVYKQVTDTETQEIIIRAKDFEKMRKIILHQNAVDYDDTFVHEDIRQWIEEQEKTEEQKRVTIEDYREVYAFGTNMRESWNLENFYPMPLRHFYRGVDKILARENYNIQMTASMSGLVSFKGEITHWMTANKKNSIYEKYFKELN